MPQSDKLEHIKDLLSLQEKMNQIFKEVMEPPTISTNIWSPLVDIYELEKEIVVKIDLPEVDQKNIQVNIEGELLSIEGERTLPEEVDQEKFYRIERFHGKFLRQITLPFNIDQEKVSADYKNGVLTITLSKLAPKLTKQITVKIN
ncbi:MAG: Hsp20/alpha crystallin family protein [Acidobacteria bacterium]|nr:Hsp20/alpha crystallin family protein [Acidobacteriota bacterium]